MKPGFVIKSEWGTNQFTPIALFFGVNNGILCISVCLIGFIFQFLIPLTPSK